MSKYWIKLYHEILNDPKMGQLSDHLFRRTIELFLLAGEVNDDGKLPCIDDMAWRLRVNIDALQVDLENLQTCRIVTCLDGEWIVTKFADRQRPATEAERIERYRENKRKEELVVTNRYKNVTEKSNAVVTNTVPDIDIDIDIDKKRNAPKNGAYDVSSPTPAKPPKHPKRQELINHFLAKTGLPVPRGTDVKAMQTLWWTPIDDVLEFCGGDIDLAKSVVENSVIKLKASGMTISEPKSILRTARSVFAERNAPTPANNASEVY